MNSQNLLPILLTVAALFGSKLFDVIFDRILTPYIPERKKLISYIKKFLNLIFTYILPITSITLLLVSDKPFDKWRIFWLVLSVCILFFNISQSFIKSILNKIGDILQLVRDQHEMNKEAATLMERMKDIYDKISTIPKMGKKKKKKKDI